MLSKMFIGSVIIASASAFITPMSVRVSSSPSHSSLTMNSEGTDYVNSLPGAPFPGDEVFDPLGFSENAKPADIKRWRESEIKHGRVAMLASLGVIVAESLNPLGNTGPAIYQFQEITEKYPQFWALSLLGMALLEYKSIITAFAEPNSVTGEAGLKEDYVPGDLGFDPLGFMPKTEAQIKDMQTKELNNGRLAMIGFAMMMLQELTGHSTIFGG